jgi:hypothetical protein
MRLTQLHKTQKDARDEDAESSDDDDDDSSDDAAGLDDDAVLDCQRIQHAGTINRVRVMPQASEGGVRAVVPFVL